MFTRIYLLGRRRRRRRCRFFIFFLFVYTLFVLFFFIIGIGVFVIIYIYLYIIFISFCISCRRRTLKRLFLPRLHDNNNPFGRREIYSRVYYYDFVVRFVHIMYI